MSQAQWVNLLLNGLKDTLYMTIPSTLFAYLVGMPLGILFVVTGEGHILPKPKINAGLGVIINFLRSIPFIILLAMLIPVTRIIMGSVSVPEASSFPCSSVPFLLSPEWWKEASMRLTEAL